MKNLGWMLLPKSWLALDKQQHGVLAYFIQTVTFFLLVKFLVGSGNTNLLLEIIFVLGGVVISFIVGYLIELYQKKTGKGQYDIKDAKIMPIAALAIGIFWIILRQLTH